MKFKVGDKVKIKSWDKMAKEFGVDWDGDIKTCPYFVKEMKKFCGKTVTIARVTNDWFKIKESEEYSFCEDMIETKLDAKIVITSDGKTTTTKLYEGNNLVKTSEAKCCPSDEFDFETGAKIAFERLFEKPFTKADLKSGMFVKASDGSYGVVVNDKIIYDDGEFDSLSNMREDLRFGYHTIDAVIDARSFLDAKHVFETNDAEHIIWRRG